MTKEEIEGKSTVLNNSGISDVDFSGLSLLGKRIETNLGNKGIVVKEWLCYPEPSEWVLDNGYVFTEETMYIMNETIISIQEGGLND